MELKYAEHGVVSWPVYQTAIRERDEARLFADRIKEWWESALRERDEARAVAREYLVAIKQLETDHQFAKHYAPDIQEHPWLNDPLETGE